MYILIIQTGDVEAGRGAARVQPDARLLPRVPGAQFYR